MAEANVTKKTIEIDTVSLHLSKEEADALVSVTGAVGGDPERTGRKHIKAIAEALAKNDINHRTSQFKNHLTGTIFFNINPVNRGNDFSNAWALSSF